MKTLYVDIRSKPDNMDRETFFLYWWSNNIGYYRNESGWHGQIFHARLNELLEGIKGYNVVYGKPDEKQGRLGI